MADAPIKTYDKIKIVMSDLIENLLNQAAAQADSSAPDTSSETSAEREFPSETEAKNAFRALKEKLFDIERWNAESGISSFALFDKDGKAQPKKRAAVGDFIKITLPASGKDDWVKIKSVREGDDEIVLTIQPSPNPTAEEDGQTTSHFFTADSTNNFCLQQLGAKLKFYVIGLNEKTNTDDTSGILETVRNAATANVGYYLGIQKTQWKIFCENFLEMRSEK